MDSASSAWCRYFRLGGSQAAVNNWCVGSWSSRPRMNKAAVSLFTMLLVYCSRRLIQRYLRHVTSSRHRHKIHVYILYECVMKYWLVSELRSRHLYGSTNYNQQVLSTFYHAYDVITYSQYFIEVLSEKWRHDSPVLKHATWMLSVLVTTKSL